MKAIKQLCSYGLVVLLAMGCVSVPKTPQEAINNANLVITAVAQQTRDNITNNVMLPAEGQDVFDKLVEYGALVDEAEVLLAAGQDALAMSKARIVERLLISLQQKVAKKARQP